MKINLISVAQYPAPIRLGIFLLILAILWLPRAALIYLLVGLAGNGDSPGVRNLLTILTMALLFADFLFLLRIWGENVYRQPQLLKKYGVTAQPQNNLDLLKGLSLGVVITFSLFGLESLLGWVAWQSPTMFLPQLILEGLLSALGVGFAEELVFRGWLLDELQRDYRPNISLWIGASIFAISHFIKPISEIIRTFPQFPALLLLGLTLVWAKRGSKGRLGISIGLHAGLVWGYYMINVGQMVQYSGSVPEWITGVDKNPLAGVMGLGFLSAIALWMRKRSLKYRNPS
ncbi:Abortive infection protein [Crinalium epipsammum PCC 9333]|uniref:Abortive infection protein n=1 Tax=Crinalium epipsammum PCC 9333 TaxID=1173022 RepID=K9VWD7_9CYAN|nr:CPBP family intramembrane glutamic endopeptidase [Crinalium epipsammum]AFZ11874.1 Abortive infection protein [Crinalium epipsammum PCC 9333]